MAPRGPAQVQDARSDAGRPTADPIHCHATAIDLDGRTALLMGPSGAGKSDLALRMLSLTSGPGWSGQPRLIADDQVVLARAQKPAPPPAGGSADTTTRPGIYGHVVRATCPPKLAGLMEIRRVGVVRLRADQSAATGTVTLVIALSDAPAERFPLTTDTVDLLGVPVPRLLLNPHYASAPHLALAALAHGLAPPHAT